MKDYNNEIARLLAAYLLGTISKEEEEKLQKWINAKKENQVFFKSISSTNRSREKFITYRSTNWKKALQRFEDTYHPSKKRFIYKIARYAAIFIIFIGVVLIFQTRENTILKNPSSLKTSPRIISQATLTLSNGQHITLSSNDSLSLQNLVDIKVNQKKNQLKYNKGKQSSKARNTLRTPRGGEYQVILEDGTLIHLNAATELKYPVVFDSLKREVYLSGEAWFEVQKDMTRPFIVKTDHAKILVHGTKFNINTFGEEEVQTVLLEGSVGIQGNASTTEYFLKPSQLASVSKNNGEVKIKEVDPLLYTGWKDGLLVFSNERLETIMDKIAMWYDIDTFYSNEALKNYRFSGYLKKYDNIEIILKAISESVEINCMLKDGAIIISQ